MFSRCRLFHSCERDISRMRHEKCLQIRLACPIAFKYELTSQDTFLVVTLKPKT